MSPSIVFFVLSLFESIHTATAMKNGIVGFGISLYQDLCCQSCHDSLSSLYLNCTTFTEGDNMAMDMNMSMMGTTSDECHASNTPWLETMAYCIKQNCDANGYPSEKQAECFSVQAVAGASEPTFQDSLPATAPTVELSEDAMWLNATSLVNHNIYHSTYGTLGEFARSEYIHTRYAVILYLVIIGICIGSGVLAQVRSAFPGFEKRLQASSLWAKFQQYIALPALMGSRRLEALPGSMGYVPGRIISIFIAIYVILNVIFSSVSFHNFWPNTWFPSPQFETCEYVGNRTGILSLVNMSIAILFAGRNNVLIAATGWSQTAFLTLHRWAARVAVLQAVVHSIVYTLAYFEPGSDGAAAYASKAAEPFYWWGIIGTIALCLAIAFAILPIRIKFYEFFLITHIVFVILSLVACWYHLVPHFGYDYGYQVWLYIAFAFWAADRVARLARVAYYNHLGNSVATVEAIPGCDILQITVSPRSSWGFGPGQHTFLYFPGLGKFWESHPFSIAGWKTKGQDQQLPTASISASPSYSSRKDVHVKESPAADLDSQPGSPARNREGATFPLQTQVQDRASIQFLTRVHAGLTCTLQRRLLASNSPSSMEISVYTEGPYAGHRKTLQPLSQADTVLCIVGGIGITHALGFVQEYASAWNPEGGEEAGRSRGGVMKKAKRFILAWSAREMAFIEHVKQNFLVDVEGMEYSIWCTGQPSSTTVQKSDCLSEGQQANEFATTVKTAVPRLWRMDIGTVIRSSLETGRQTTVLVCGPGSMTDEATKQVVACLKEGFQVDLVEESYAW